MQEWTVSITPADDRASVAEFRPCILPPTTQILWCRHVDCTVEGVGGEAENACEAASYIPRCCAQDDAGAGGLGAHNGGVHQVIPRWR
jgi:hypothetical protein